MTQPSYQPPSGSLIVRQGPIVGQTFPLTKADITIGRVMGNDVIVNHPEVSRRHARLTWDGHRFIIQDLGSSNGTFVNGIRITAPQSLKDGDAIGLGDVLLSFHTPVAVAEADVTQFGLPRERAYPPPTAKGGLPRTLIAASLGVLALLIILAAVVTVWFLGSRPAPVAVINSPLSGSQARVGEEVVITSTSTDSKGVTRVELWVNGTLYHTEFSPSPQGQPTFSTQQTWTASSAGSHALEVRAYNAAGQVSDPAAIVINVEAGTVAPEATLTPAPTLTTPLEVTPSCVPNVAFVADVTVPDGTIFGPGERFDKIWRFRNSGDCPWESGYQLVFISGEQMGAPPAQAVSPTSPGGTADIAVTMYTPSTPGTYVGHWRMRDTSGLLFGQTVTVQIVILAPATPTPTATATQPAPSPPPSPPPPPPVGIDFRADDYSLGVGDCTMLRWDVENATAIYLRWEGHEEGVVGHSQKQVCPATPGDHVYTLHVVHAGGSEDRTVTLTVTGTPPPPAQPDLYISELSLDPSSPHQGEVVTVRVGDYNQGDAPAGHHKVQWWSAEGSPVRCEWEVASLVAHGGRILTCNYTYGGWNPAYKTRAATDVDGEMDESNEGNNTRELVVNVQPP